MINWRVRLTGRELGKDVVAHAFQCPSVMSMCEKHNRLQGIWVIRPNTDQVKYCELCRAVVDIQQPTEDEQAIVDLTERRREKARKGKQQ